MYSSIYSGKTILITGHTGFKGAWLCLWLRQMGAKVIGISFDIPTEPSLFEALELENDIEHHVIDVRDVVRVREIIEQSNPDFLFHLAAQSLVSVAYNDPLETISINVLGTAAILEACRVLKNSCQLIIVTSDKCYQNVEWEWGYRETDKLGGNDIYSCSKSCAELIADSFRYSYFQDSAVNIATARSGNVVGGGDWALDRIIPDCIRSWSQKRVVSLRNPHSVRPWQHVLEPLSGYLRLGQLMAETKQFDGESFNFGPFTHEEFSVLELVKILAKQWGFNNLDDAFQIRTEGDFKEANYLKLNCDKALKQLHWMPSLSFVETIELTGSWYQQYYSKDSDMKRVSLDQIEFYVGKATKIVTSSFKEN